MERTYAEQVGVEEHIEVPPSFVDVAGAEQLAVG